MRAPCLAAAALVAGALLAAAVRADDKDKLKGHHGSEPSRRASVASEDACQWVTASLPVDPDAEATVFRGPFFLTYLQPGEPVSIVVPQEGADPVVLGHLTEVSGGTRILIPEGAYVVAPKGKDRQRLYSGFRPYAER